MDPLSKWELQPLVGFVRENPRMSKPRENLQHFKKTYGPMNRWYVVVFLEGVLSHVFVYIYIYIVIYLYMFIRIGFSCACLNFMHLVTVDISSLLVSRSICFGYTLEGTCRLKTCEIPLAAIGFYHLFLAAASTIFHASTQKNIHQNNPMYRILPSPDTTYITMVFPLFFGSPVFQMAR